MTAGTGAAPLDLAAPWGGRSQVADLDGPVHWVDFGGPEGAPAVVLVHGLGGSHLNWVQIASPLADTYRVRALDLAGFGLTPGHDRSTTVHANAELLARFLEEVVGAPAILVANSMGGMVALLLASARPDLVDGLALISPSLPTERHPPDRGVALAFLVQATPFVGERVVTNFERRLTDQQRVSRTVNLCFADPTRSDAGVFDASVALSAYRRSLQGVDAGYVKAARSLLRVLRGPGRYAALIRGVSKPVLLIHGEKDRLVPVGAARRAAADNPGWRTVFLPGVGHTPQLEVPDVVLGHLRTWLADTAPPAK
ncbi:alpha/beta fold hydrolase [Intrasporangium oryzae]|nr:alpha/beta hydrolase [Intrasporangium oryzae]